MYTHDLNYSRRGFLALAGAGLYSVGRAATAFEGITARQVIERIQKNVGLPWRSETVDTFKIRNGRVRKVAQDLYLRSPDSVSAGRRSFLAAQTMNEEFQPQRPQRPQRERVVSL